MLGQSSGQANPGIDERLSVFFLNPAESLGFGAELSGVRPEHVALLVGDDEQRHRKSADRLGIVDQGVEAKLPGVFVHLLRRVLADDDPGFDAFPAHVLAEALDHMRGVAAMPAPRSHEDGQAASGRTGAQRDAVSQPRARLESLQVKDALGERSESHEQDGRGMQASSHARSIVGTVEFVDGAAWAQGKEKAAFSTEKRLFL